MNLELYYESLPPLRKQRLLALRKAFREAWPETHEDLHYKMPTFHFGNNWVCLGNQKHHISIYFCSESLIAEIVSQRPDLNCGKGCVRIRDTQEPPEKLLVSAFKRAMSQEKP